EIAASRQILAFLGADDLSHRLRLLRVDPGCQRHRLRRDRKGSATGAFDHHRGHALDPELQPPAQRRAGYRLPVSVLIRAASWSRPIRYSDPLRKVRNPSRLLM